MTIKNFIFTFDPVPPPPMPKTPVCEGCREESGDLVPVGWMQYFFEKLDPCWLCPPCRDQWGRKLSELQMRGL